MELEKPKDQEIGGYTKIGGGKYPILKINKSEYNRLKTQWGDKRGMPRYCCEFDDCMRILPNAPEGVCFDIVTFMDNTAQSST